METVNQKLIFLKLLLWNGDYWQIHYINLWNIKIAFSVHLMISTFITANSSSIVNCKNGRLYIVNINLTFRPEKVRNRSTNVYDENNDNNNESYKR